SMQPNDLGRYLPSLTETQLQQLGQLATAFLDWNTRVNLVSRKDAENLSERHLLHSLSIALYWQPAPGAQVLDIGCGGGLPGLPLALLFPQVQFTLLDSIGKKIDAVRDMAQQLGLANVQAIWGRAEQHPARYDYVLGRAVTRLPAFVQLAKPHLKPPLTATEPRPGNLDRGILYLKGGDFRGELEEAGCQYQLFPLTQPLDLPFYETKMLVYLHDCR
ncbi:MAG: 16S rRNA (guanine(527)-N(7))-methyltransferase RsmG, partial [bacterium]